jgi:cell division protein FtsB
MLNGPNLKSKTELFELGIDLDPTVADVIVYPVDEHGNISKSFLAQRNLNSMGKFAYSKANKLDKGFEIMYHNQLKPALAVVVSDANNIRVQYPFINLMNGLEVMGSELFNKIVWIPVSTLFNEEDNDRKVIEILQEELLVLQDKISCQRILLSLDDSEESYYLMNTRFEERIGDYLNDRKAFLVGSYWDGQEQAPRFIELGLWENGYKENFLNEIRQINEGDILLLKSTFQQAGESYLRIKAIGKVTNNPGDGRKLEVNWYPIENHDFPGYGHYRKTIQEPNPQHVLDILAALVRRLDQLKDWLFQNENINEKPGVSQLNPDAPNGPDHLDFQSDIKAFSEVITFKKVQPPLAIGLFGRWGTGKSFFMKSLSERIEGISNEAEDEDPFCKGIAQIHFNAWSYMDTNLWAGLITKIYSGLFDYVKNNAKSGMETEVEMRLSKQLSIAKEELDLIESKEEQLGQNLKDLKDTIGDKEKIRGSLHQDLAKKTRSRAVIKLAETFSLQDKLNTEEQEGLKALLGISGSLEPHLDPKALNEQLRSTQLFFSEVFKPSFLWIGAGILTLSTIFFVISFWYPVFNVFSVIATIILPLLTLGGQIGLVFQKIRPFWIKFATLKEEYLTERQKLEDQFRIEAKEIEAKISSLQKNIDQGKERATFLESEIANFEHRKKNLLATETLYSFIEERAKGDTYKKYYGIISLIRDDFDLLSKLLLNHKGEMVRENEKKPDLEFHELFIRPLERVVLYIDDLDRCSEKKVVQVLEAVNLILAYPLFVVVVGVDPRWVKNALLKEHHGQFGLYSKDLAHKDLVPMEASNYLEKIFQIPFHLKQADTKTVQGMLAALTPIKVTGAVNEGNSSHRENPDGTMGKKESQFGEGESVTRADAKPQLKTKDQPTSLELEPIELELMQELAEVIGPNPRAIKRFVNVYLIIRAHDYKVTISHTEHERHLITQFLLALCVGPYKCLVDQLEEQFIPAPGLNLSSFFNHDFKDELFQGKRMNLYLADLGEIIGHYERLRPLLRIENNLVYSYYNFVRRFTFRGSAEELSFD